VTTPGVTELPRSLHTSVNSPRSNAALEAKRMSDSELWSLPWHARLRSLAKGFGADTAFDAGVGRNHSAEAKAAAEAGSWLTRVRSTASRTAASEANR
jgi:hypothetical protein